MAKAEFVLKGNFDIIIKKIEDGIEQGSLTASLEESADHWVGNARMAVRVFERFSYSGGNRVSLTVTLFQPEGTDIYVTAITTGGSQAMFLKFNTFGEEAFLDKFRELMKDIGA